MIIALTKLSSFNFTLRHCFDFNYYVFWTTDYEKDLALSSSISKEISV